MPATTFVNARVVIPQGIAASIRFDDVVRGLNERPGRGDTVIDVQGAFVLPGLVNAHDHLELNHYGRLKGRDRYDNAAAWVDDMSAMLAQDESVRANMRHPLSARLFVGGLKNLLAGTTTVAHHNPPYPEFGRRYPVRVVRRYGWAHSFLLEHRPTGAGGEPGGDVRTRFIATPHAAPFIVHLGEGIDDSAAGELQRLDEAGCLTDRTVLVHGVALSERDWDLVVSRGAALVWCPASNAFLLRRTVPVRAFLDRVPNGRAHLCLGTDSRLTGTRDLLEELRAAAVLAPVSGAELLRMVTTAPAQILRLEQAGALVIGAPADLIVVPRKADEPGEALLRAARAHLELVAVGGVPMCGSAAFAPLFAEHGGHARLLVDGVERLGSRALVRGMAECPIREPGVVCA